MATNRITDCAAMSGVPKFLSAPVTSFGLKKDKGQSAKKDDLS